MSICCAMPVRSRILSACPRIGSLSSVLQSPFEVRRASRIPLMQPTPPCWLSALRGKGFYLPDGSDTTRIYVGGNTWGSKCG
jgi:hypothetical protein